MAKRPASAASPSTKRQKTTESSPTRSTASEFATSFRISEEHASDEPTSSATLGSSTPLNTQSGASESENEKASTPLKTSTTPNEEDQTTLQDTLMPAIVTTDKLNRVPTPISPARSHDGTVNLPSLPVHTHMIRFQPADAFPIFKTGDVVIRTGLGSSSATFQLHSSNLMRHSPWFANEFQKDFASEATSTWYLFRIEVINGRVMLNQYGAEGMRPEVSNSSTAHIIHGVEIKVEDISDDMVNAASAPSTPPSSVSNRHTTSPPEQTVNPKTALACYTQLLGAFYNIPPAISTINIDTALVQAEELVKLGTELGCLHLLRSHLGNVLSAYRQKLFLAIKTDPVRWVKLAIPLENKSIYTESLVHLIGAHPCWPWPTRRATLPPHLRRLVRNQSHQISQSRTESERDVLLSSIPYGRLGTPLDPTDRAQTETWLTVQVFKDQVAQRLDSLDRSPEGALQRGSLFRALGKGTWEALDVESVRNVCEGTMHSAWLDLSEDLKRLKVYAAQLVEDLAANELMIDPDANGVGYLTCAKVGDQDIPWLASVGSES